jgi:hypothetical protein
MDVNLEVKFAFTRRLFVKKKIYSEKKAYKEGRKQLGND